MENSVFSIGNPLLDISANVDPAFLEKYELQPDNAIIAEEKHIPIYNEIIENYEPEFIAGGAAQNTIRSLQWMVGVENVTHYVGCIGNDNYGTILKQAVSKDGVNAHFLETDEHPTGTCAALIVDKDRSLVANLGAANAYKYEHFKTDEIQEIINNAKYFYVAGYFVTVCIDAIIDLGKNAKENNKDFFLNLSAPFIMQAFGEQLKQIIPYATTIACNESEAATIGEVFNLGDNLKDIALSLSTYLTEGINGSSRTVIFTQGPEPTIVVKNGNVHEFPPIAIDKNDIVDLNGAGDCFMGGYLAAYIQNKPLETCVNAGHYCANKIIKTSGIKFDGENEFSFE